MSIQATFSWSSLVDPEPKELRLQMTKAALAERDPDGTSLLSAKLRFEGK